MHEDGATGATDAYGGASTRYSDDHGKSWTAAPHSPGTGNGADEIELAELNTPTDDDAAATTLYMTIRNDGAPGGHRQYSTSTDQVGHHPPYVPAFVPGSAPGPEVSLRRACRASAGRSV